MSTTNGSKANAKTSHPLSAPNVRGEGTTNASVRKENKIDKIFDEFQIHSDELPAVKEGVMETFSIVKGEIGNFVQSSNGLIRALDEVGKLHPFIMIAVIPFKAALALELKRRENIKKVQALMIQMNTMMATLKSLATIKPAELGADTESLAQRMDARLKEAAVAIEECSHVTNEYYKMKDICVYPCLAPMETCLTAIRAKWLKSGKWEQKFTDLATKFTDFQSDFTADLALYTGAGVQTTVRAVAKMDEKMSMVMKMVFIAFASPSERELLSFIETQGGPDAFMKDDKLLLDLINKSQTQRGEADPGDDRAGQGKGTFDLNSAFEDTKQELKADLDGLLAGSKEFFSRKFDEQKDQIANVRDDIRRESDRIVGQLRSGAHDRILDKHLHAIWAEMGWKGSTKTLDLVLALRDFYVNDHQYVLSLGTPQIAGFPSKPQGEDDGEKDEQKEVGPKVFDTEGSTPEDAWAIAFLSRSHLSRLMEAIDIDCSGHVTIKEINDFTSSRPAEWSLPQWIAYWTLGFEVTLRKYCSRIRGIFLFLHSLYGSLVPGNAGVFSSVMTFRIVEYVIGRIRTIDADDIEDEYQNPSFEAYAKGIEKDLKKRLKRLNYHIDDRNTLSLVIDSGRFEECFFPLVYLLLDNCVRITLEGAAQRLQFADFNNTLYSFNTLWNAALERVAGLRRDFQLRNLSVTDEFRRYSYGMYYYVIAFDELDKDRDYFNFDFDPFSSDDADEEENDIQRNSNSAHNATNANDDLNFLDQFYQETNLNVSESSGLVGTWSGFYDSNSSDITSFQIKYLDGQGRFTGGGRDYVGDFSLDGTLEGKTIALSQKYSRPLEVDGVLLKWSGEINEGLDKITGKYGVGESESGTFELEKKSVEYVQFCPSGAKDVDGEKKSRLRMLWRFAIKATLHRLHACAILWAVLKERRDQRRRFIALFKKSRAVGLDGSETAELKTVQSMLSIVELALYRRLAFLEQDREVVHRILCDGCGRYIRMTRFICLDCSAGRYIHTVDICSDCVGKPLTTTREEGTVKLDHLPTHTLLQIRRPLSSPLQLPAREIAQLTVQSVPPNSSAEDSKGVYCTDCRDRVQRPYWVCCDCPDVYICVNCNTETEQSRPWLYERAQIPPISAKGDSVDMKNIAQEETEHKPADSQELSMAHEADTVASQSGSDSEPTTISSSEDLDPDLKHPWSHDLVLCTSSEDVSPPVSLEGRVIGLEESLHKLQNQTTKLEAQLERLEQLLRTAQVGQ